MMNPLIYYSGAVFLTAVLGGIAPIVIPTRFQSHSHLFVCCGAGLLLGLAFLHMIPEAAEILPHVFGIWFLVGFLLLLVLERFLMVHPCEEHGCDYHTIGVAAFVGLSVHGVIEGLALASSLLVPQLGPLVLLAILAHTAPQGFALTSLLIMAGKNLRQVLLFLIGVALSGPIGMVSGVFLLRANQPSETAGILLSISAGTFVYIGACDLLPELHRKTEDKIKRLVAFFIGLFLSAASGLIIH